jgi:drug/metabolite transporter (DMT)-like permease
MSGSRAKLVIPPHLVLAVGVCMVSTASVMIRKAQVGADSLAIAAWRLTLASLMLAPFALTMRRAELKSLSGKEWRLAIISGVLLAIHFGSWIASLAYTSVAASVVFVTTHPLFVGLASHLFLQERLSWPMAAGLIAGVAGSALIGLDDAGQGTHRLFGDALALLGGITAAGYFLIGRQLRGRLSLLGYIFPVYGTAAVVLMAVALLSGVEMTGLGGETWFWLVLMALGPQILGHSSLNWSLRHLTASYVTLVVLAEPIGSTLLAWLMLGEPPTLMTAAGGGLILAGISAASLADPRARRQGKSDLAKSVE